MRGYIYLISFENTNDIYIGKTTRQNVYERLKEHKRKKCTVHKHIAAHNIKNIYIDIIDSIDMNEDLSNFREKIKYIFNMNDYKLSCLEMFHINNYINEGRYNVINKSIIKPSAHFYSHYDELFNYTKK